MAGTISWPELIVLMGFGDDGGDLRGTFRVRDVTEVYGDPDLDDDDWWDRVEHHPDLGRVAIAENDGGLAVRGSSFRLLDRDGSPLLIQTPDDSWFVAADDGTAEHHDPRRTFVAMQGLPERLLHRPMPSRWEGDDFTRPAGPIVATEFLGRAAWALELAPPSHKPFPLQLIVDAATGRVLSHRNDGFGSVTEWTSVEFGLQLPDDTFEWDGPIRGTSVLDIDEEYSGVGRDDGLAWLAARGIDRLTVPIPLQLDLFDHDDDTGAFHLEFHTTLHGSLLRRPASDDPWNHGFDGFGGVYDWRAGDQDWRLVTHEELSAEQLQAIRDQLP